MKFRRAMGIPLGLAPGVALLAALGLQGQTVTSPPAFEVASIKLSDPARGHLGILTYPGGRVNFGHQTLELLVADALDFQTLQVTGATGWMRDEQFDIDAKPPATSESGKAGPLFVNAPMNDEQRQMLLTLLADRFQLKFHREAREGAVFLLLKGNKPLRLEPPKETRTPSPGSEAPQKAE